jgi:hypothetical protein
MGDVLGVPVSDNRLCGCVEDDRWELTEEGREGMDGFCDIWCSAKNCSKKSTIRGSFITESLYSSKVYTEEKSG